MGTCASIRANRKLIFFDSAVLGLSAVLTSGLLMFGAPSMSAVAQALVLAALMMIAGLVILPLQGLYRRDVRSTSLPDVYNVVHGLAGLHVVAGVPLLAATSLPVSVPFLAVNFFVSVFGFLMMRAIARQREHARRELRAAAKTDEREPVLVVGTGASADLFMRSLLKPGAKYEAVGVVDDISGTNGLYFHSARIFGSILVPDRVLSEVAKLPVPPKKIILTETSGQFGATELQTLIDWASEAGIEVARLPDLGQSNGANRPEPRTVEIDEILNRPEKMIERRLLARLLAGRRVLVTGAGGSIGSELVRQIAALDPSEIVLIDSCEYNAYSIDKSLDRDFNDVTCHTYVADIRDKNRVNSIFNAHRPEVVFNAAALKHVPLVEMNPCEGVLTNVVGTRNIADACRNVGAIAMVQISTDKAVNSTNVMGASKRVAEFYVQAQDRITNETAEQTRFFSVRFGNVLGSSGSLIPLFQEQISRGGPLTVTDPRMERYFMTIREAVELTLVAAAKGLENHVSRGTIFVLDMGRPVKILDIAHRMIRLAGLEPERDIAIEFIGTRPGEKLYEELFDDSEMKHDSGIEGVRSALPAGIHIAPLRNAIVQLEQFARAQLGNDVRRVLGELVPGFTPKKIDTEVAETIVSEALKTPPANTPTKVHRAGARA